MILVFGSLNLDLVVTAPDHAQPGETVICDSSRLSPGGKGCNQAVAASRAGASVVMIGRVGEDTFGSLLIDSLLANGVDVSGVGRTPGVLTGCAFVAVDEHGQNLIYVAPGANSSVRDIDVSDERLTKAAVVVCQMEVPSTENWHLLKRAKACGATTILNFAPARDVDTEAVTTIKDWVDLLVVNREEAAQLAAHLNVTPSKHSQFVRSLARSLAVHCILTLGAEGVLASDGGKVWNIPSPAVQVKDTTGAGDTFTGFLAAMLDDRRSIQEAVRLACVAASLSCREVGAQASMPTRTEVEQVIALS